MTGLSQPEKSFSDEAWERVRREANLFAGQGGVIATMRPSLDQTRLTGTGPTTTAAMRDLAVHLDNWLYDQRDGHA